MALLQVIQSNVQVAILTSRETSNVESVFKIMRLVDEIKALKLDKTEWGLVETLVMGGKRKK